MIKLVWPVKTPEIKYIIEVIFKEFLQTEYVLSFAENSESKIILPNATEIMFRNHLVEYDKYNNSNHPHHYYEYSGELNDHKVTPVIFGKNNIHVESSFIVCEIDLLFTCFFMLTRLEEYGATKLDVHKRFSSAESLAHKYNFLDRPIVDEYVDLLKKMVSHLDPSIKFSSNKRKIFLTHDVDSLYLWKNWQQVFKVATVDVVKRRDFALALQRMSEFFLIERNRIKDPYDTYDYLMDKSESLGIKSHFYFMSGGETKYDNQFSITEPKAKKLIKKIKSRGHIIGLHPSYNAYCNLDMLLQEKRALERVCEIEVSEGRQHYLRFENPTTWQIWDDAGMAVDSTCGYADQVGFRCGTGSEFSVFNLKTRQRLKLKERPLVVMDGSLFDYNDHSYQDAHDIIKNMYKNSEVFTVLWHNSYVNHLSFYEEQIRLFRKIST